MAAIRQWRVRLFRDGEHVRDCFPRALGGVGVVVPHQYRFNEPFREDFYKYVSWDTHAGIMNAEFQETRTLTA
jgi:hypothetical protein